MKKGKLLNKSADWLWVVGLLVILAIAGFVGANYQFASANAQGPEVNSSLPDVSILSQTGDAGTSSKDTVNGIEIEASNFRVESGRLLVDVCFELPSEADWLLDLPFVEIGGETISAWEVNLIDFRYGEDGTPTHRCDWAGIPLDEGTEVSTFTLVIPRLETSSPDNLDCDLAQKKLDQAETGIVVECFEGDFTYGYTVVQKPDDMSDEQAYQIAADAFIETLDGPWNLEGEIK
jgi:hypothetical protein